MRKVSVLYIAAGLVLVVTGLDAVAQSTRSGKPTAGESRILNEFRQNLGKRLKVFRAIPADLSGKGESFVVAVTQDSNDLKPKLRIFLNGTRLHRRIRP